MSQRSTPPAQSLAGQSLATRVLATVALLLCACANIAVAQEYDTFRLVGDHPTSTSGFVTSVSFNADASEATINYLNVAGVSSVFEAELSTAATIPANLPVFMPPSGFVELPPPSLDLAEIRFFNGRLTSAEDGPVPDHWFRLTLFNNRFSGVFRIDNRIYAINRYSSDPTVLVHPAKQNRNKFRPTRRVKVSAIIDEQYLIPDAIGDERGMDNTGHLFALESINTMDGLLTDSLGITVLLEQLIYQPSPSLISNSQPHDAVAGAKNWYGSNADAFGLTDNIATLFFRGDIKATDQTTSDNPQLAQTTASMILQGNSENYQFATAHYFGALLGVIDEPGTLQDWQHSGARALPNIHWSERQRNLVELNPPPDQFTQTISYDEPAVAVQPEETVNEVDNRLVIAEIPEGGNGGIISDDFTGTAQTASTESGGGSFNFWLLMLTFLARNLCTTARRVYGS